VKRAIRTALAVTVACARRDATTLSVGKQNEHLSLVFVVFVVITWQGHLQICDVMGNSPSSASMCHCGVLGMITAKMISNPWPQPGSQRGALLFLPQSLWAFSIIVLDIRAILIN